MEIGRISILRKSAVAIALAGVVAGCASDPLRLESEPHPFESEAEVRATTGTTFRLRPGQTASVAGRLLVAFRGVTSDSRCPSGVECVWAGDAEAVVGFATEGGSWGWTSLHTGVEPRAAEAHGFIIRLVSVEPAATANVTITPERYVAIFEVTQ